MTDRLLIVVLDGVGHRPDPCGNAVTAARTPWLDYLGTNGLFTTLKAHGKWIGMPEEDDLGNSEVGHNTIGAGRVFAQGATLVNKALASGEVFKGKTWQQAIANVLEHNSTLHFMGLLSDGNVHSHQNHLHTLLTQAKKDGVRRVRVHVLLDGRDVAERSAERYVGHLLLHLRQLVSDDFDACIASCGGRMRITMDRYEANWELVHKGWEIHVLGEGRKFASVQEGISTIRHETGDSDQFLSPFIIDTSHGTVTDGDSVIFFNFRGDRAVQVSQAFTRREFTKFPRKKFPHIFYAGMMEYDPDRKLPPRFLVSPPRINNTLTEYLIPHRVRQFACSESQKYGHVTYFWNGNHSDYFEPKLEEYLEIPSDKNLNFEHRPWMKAAEITEATITRLRDNSFDFARINFPNGDMVGHSGDYEATIMAMTVVDLMLGRIIAACQQYNVKLIVTADHGNCDEMFEQNDETKPKTSHSLSEVPFYFFAPHQKFVLAAGKNPTLANIANTALTAMGLPPNAEFQPSILKPAP